jgi:hypothetical protein
MYYISRCYKCGHYVIFRKAQKTVLCRRCNRKLKCDKLRRQKKHKVDSLAKASVAVAALESRDKKVGFGTMRVE